MKVFLTAVVLLLTSNIFAADLNSISTSNSDASISDISTLNTGSYYNWGRGGDGYGYCYQWTYSGQVLNGGAPQPNYFCEQTRPSYYSWGRGGNGYGYCYQFTPQGLVMNKGNKQSEYFCEQTRPSYYSWGRGGNGMTYCYKYTPQGFVLNDGQPVNNYFCQR